MGQLTSRAGLYLPGGGSTGLIQPDETADIDRLNDNFRKIDGLLGARTVPSASSYAGNFDGDLIYPRDDEVLRVYDGSSSSLKYPRTRGGTRYVGTKAEREAFSGAVKGDSWFDTGTNLEMYYTGSAWRYVKGQVLLSTGASGSATSSGSAYVLIPGLNGTIHFPASQDVAVTLAVASNATALSVLGARVMRNNTSSVGTPFNGPSNSSPITAATGNFQTFTTRSSIPAGDHSFAGQFNLSVGGGTVTAHSGSALIIQSA